MSGGTSIALGAGYVLFSGSIYGATLVGSGLVSLLIPSKAEKEWEIYQEEKEDLGEM